VAWRFAARPLLCGASLLTPTERAVYPNEFHGIDTPSRAKDLYEHYLLRFGRYLKGEQTAKVH
jgi:hypothetical protein